MFNKGIWERWQRNTLGAVPDIFYVAFKNKHTRPVHTDDYCPFKIDPVRGL